MISTLHFVRQATFAILHFAHIHTTNHDIYILHHRKVNDYSTAWRLGMYAANSKMSYYFADWILTNLLTATKKPVCAKKGLHHVARISRQEDACNNLKENEIEI